MSLVARSLGYSAGSKRLLQDVSLEIPAGELHAVLGPNGAGKTTLLRLLAGELQPDSGEVWLNGRRLDDWSRQDLARQRAVLPQRESLQFGFTATQVVELGRLPCRRHSPAQEQAIIADALARAGVGHLAPRRYPSLSGGERARVQLARVLAQVWEPVPEGPRALLLDEPTASLDLAHQHLCLRTARERAAEGLAVLAILHDPNLVLAYADRVSLLCCGQLLATGTPSDVLTEARLQQVYGVTVSLHGSGRESWVQVRPPFPR